jgi:hypothetical protein
MRWINKRILNYGRCVGANLPSLGSVQWTHPSVYNHRQSTVKPDTVSTQKNKSFVTHKKTNNTIWIKAAYSSCVYAWINHPNECDKHNIPQHHLQRTDLHSNVCPHSVYNTTLNWASKSHIHTQRKHNFNGARFLPSKSVCICSSLNNDGQIVAVE